MKVIQSTINDFFALTSTIFPIPVYQRNYTWEEENCEKLLQDIVSISQNKKTHFMGSITYILHLIDDEKSLRPLQEKAYHTLGIIISFSPKSLNNISAKGIA